jgi:NADPH2 dehydrogenase
VRTVSQGCLISNLKDFTRAWYIHVVEPRILGGALPPLGQLQRESNDFIRDIWQPQPLIVAGGFSGASVKKTLEDRDAFVAFGRHFITDVRFSALPQNNH